MPSFFFVFFTFASAFLPLPFCLSLSPFLPFSLSPFLPFCLSAFPPFCFCLCLCLEGGRRRQPRPRAEKQHHPKAKGEKTAPLSFLFLLGRCCFPATFGVGAASPPPLIQCFAPSSLSGRATCFRRSLEWRCFRSPSPFGWCCFRPLVVLLLASRLVDGPSSSLFLQGTASPTSTRLKNQCTMDTAGSQSVTRRFLHFHQSSSPSSKKRPHSRCVWLKPSRDLRNFAFAFCTVIELIVVCRRVVSERSAVEVIRVTDHDDSLVFSCFNSGAELCGSGTRVAAIQQ